MDIYTRNAIKKTAEQVIKIGIKAFLLPFFFMLIWNKIMPEVCGFQILTYWQAWFIGLGLRCINGSVGIATKLDEDK